MYLFINTNEKILIGRFLYGITYLDKSDYDNKDNKKTNNI